MALILPGVGFGEARGSIGAVTYSKNRGGAYMRARTKPVNPPSAFSDEVHLAQSNLAQSWAALSSSEQAQWIAATPSRSHFNVFGLPTELSGQQLYIATNMRLVLYRSASVSSPPLNWDVASQPLVSFAIDTTPGMGLPKIQISPGVVTAGGSALYIRMSMPLPGGGFGGYGIRNYRKYMRTIGTFDDITASPSDLDDAYEARFGDLDSTTIGKVVWLEYSLIEDTNGQISVPQQAVAIIT